MPGRAGVNAREIPLVSFEAQYFLGEWAAFRRGFVETALTFAVGAVPFAIRHCSGRMRFVVGKLG